MLTLHNISRAYKKSKRVISVLNDFTYSYNEGKIYLIKGSSGRGKTTLLSIIGLLDKPDSGQIFYNNTPIHNLSGVERTKFINQNIGFVFQQNNLMEGLTVKENVLLHYLNDKDVFSDANVKRAEDILQDVGLADRMDHYPRELSGGEMQRAEFARAIIKDPKIFILDEPISNLDDENARMVIDLIMDYAKSTNCITILSCHTNYFDDLADEIIKL